MVTPPVQKFLMSPPDYFDAHFMFNPWMKYSEAVDRKLAEHQWRALVANLEILGAEIEILEPFASSPAQVFTADGALQVKRGHFLVLRNDGARGVLEHERFANWLRNAGYQTEQLPPKYRLDGGNIVQLIDGSYAVGLKPGAAGQGEKYLGRLLSLVAGKSLSQFQLIDRRYLHLDMALGRLGTSGYLLFEEGFQDGAGVSKALESAGAPVVPISSEDAERLACNGVTIGDTYVTSLISKALRGQIEAMGLNVAEVDVSEFHKAGGSVKCLTLPLTIWTEGETDAE